MNAGLIAKHIVRFVVSASTGQVVSNIVKANVPQNISTVEKVLTTVGEIVVSSVIADLAADYTIKQIEEFGKKDEQKPESKEESKEE